MKLTTLLSYLISLLTPIALIGLALRILLSPIYYTIEYSMPYFPPDEYGFTKADRMQWAPYAVTYLVNNADVSYLGDLKLDDGTPLYNERELSHMADVKNVVQGALRVWYFTIVVMGFAAVFAWQGGWGMDYLEGLRRGGWWMIGLALTLGAIAGAGILLNPDIFWAFFTWFHSLFFEGDSWLFYYSDTLIRLFPIRFWQDAFLAAAVLALGGGLALALGIKIKN
ncbi:MAG TPA: TIGR01906 family membrane protein [Anaerolineales bacterium]|nr:TIGR01906 family membrane protein [Anaerolineales bacterium]HNN13119.1 TIGR01906 family membrane protein [Anaerolineales bacterium]HNO30975.1 TIGR01906 family membrane protein [Anaerolineales bacterium]